MDNIVFRKAAELDLNEAFLCYESNRKGLGDEFLLCVEESLARISRFPDGFPTVHRNIQRCLIRRFPYGIFYIKQEDKIIVIAVFHGNRNPRSWQERR